MQICLTFWLPVIARSLVLKRPQSLATASSTSPRSFQSCANIFMMSGLFCLVQPLLQPWCEGTFAISVRAGQLLMACVRRADVRFWKEIILCKPQAGDRCTMKLPA
jgi:hypothetical protein